METFNLFLGLVAIVISLLAVYLAYRTLRFEYNITHDVLNIRSAVKGRLQFADYAIRIYSDADAMSVWAVSDTLSTDRTYFEFFKYRHNRKLLKRITYFAPLRPKQAVLIGAIIRHYIAPEATIRNISEVSLKSLLSKFPFKTVIGGGMVLVGNSPLGSHAGSEFGHFEGWQLNPYYDFIESIYKQVGLHYERTLVDWVAAQCRKNEIDTSAVSSADLKKLLSDEGSVNSYFSNCVDGKVVGEGELASAFDQLSAEVRRYAKPTPVFWEITKRCSYNCAYCLADAQNSSEGLDLSEFRRAATCLKRLNFPRVCLTGGNPTELSELVDVLTTLSEMDLDITLCSNGVISPSLNVTLIAKLTEKVTFGAPCDPFESVESRELKFKRLLKAAISVIDAGGRVEVSFVLTKGSADWIKNMLLQAASHGITQFQIQSMARLGRGVQIDQHIPALEDEQYLEKELLLEAGKFGHLHVETNDFTSRQTKYIKLDSDSRIWSFHGLDKTQLGYAYSAQTIHIEKTLRRIYKRVLISKT
jgi:MoaA/NifB/PqqE/SkfB family radical SAM enzyme